MADWTTEELSPEHLGLSSEEFGQISRNFSLSRCIGTPFGRLAQALTMPLAVNGKKVTICCERTSIASGTAQFYTGAEPDGDDLRIVLITATRNINASFAEIDSLIASGKLHDHTEISAAIKSVSAQRVRTFFNGRFIIVLTQQNASIDMLRRTISQAPKLVPGLFEGIPPEFYADMAGDFDQWAATFQAWYASVLRPSLKRKLISSAFARMSAQGLHNIEQSIGQLTDRIDEYQRNLANLYRDLNANRLQLLGYHETVKNPEELANYFARKPGLETMELKDNGSFYLKLSAPVTNYDADILRRLIKAHDRNALRQLDETGIAALKLIFLERKYTLYFKHDPLITKDQDPLRRSGLDPDPNALGMPNPHLRFYNCWGNNHRYITQAWAQGDYITAIEQIASAIGGINFTDSTVLDRWLRHVSGDDPDFTKVKSIKDNETGELMSWRGLCAFIEAQSKEEEAA